MRRLLLKFLADQSAATSIEYALIATGISIVIISAVLMLGTNVNAKYLSIGSAIK